MSKHPTAIGLMALLPLLAMLGSCNQKPGSAEPAMQSPNSAVGALDEYVSDPVTHTLDVTLVAGLRSVTIGGHEVMSNVYSVCKTPADPTQFVDCGANMKNPYAGPLLQLQPGDTLKVTLVNELVDADGAVGDPMKLLTNLHTHGLQVRARGLDPADRLADDPQGDSIGDFVFISAQPVSSEPMTMSMNDNAHAAHKVMGSVLHYEIKIPSYHPVGLFWFHPHEHGLSKIQVSGGMAGMIAIGSIDDYTCLQPSEEGHCEDESLGIAPPSLNEKLDVLEVLLKDAQLLPPASPGEPERVLYDQDPGFCGENGELLHENGWCEGSDDFEGGKWVFSVNGRSNAQWHIPSGKSVVWRIQNGSANITYDLCLTAEGFETNYRAGEDTERCDRTLPFQILSLGGASYGDDDDSNEDAQQSQFVTPQALQRRLLLMPGTQAEILVTWRDPANCTNATQKGCPAAAPDDNRTVVMQNLFYPTGGDGWPRVQLAKLTFAQHSLASDTLAILHVTDPGLPGSALPEPSGSQQPGDTSTDSPYVESTDTSTLCRSGRAYRLQPGEKRRVYFAIVADQRRNDPSSVHPEPIEESFLMGTSVLDADGVTEKAEDGSVLDAIRLRPFDAGTDRADLCVPPGGVETWQLVNLSEEVHNFHIHQGRFQVSKTADLAPSMYAPSKVDRVNLVSVLLQGRDSVAEELPVHDTILVPRSDEAVCSAQEITDDSDGSFLQRVPDSFDLAAPEYLYRPDLGCKVDAPLQRTGSIGWIEVDIPFVSRESLGKYVFHCHILEHEDKGMMSSIRVLTPEQAGEAL